jgi:hypothetical protein
VHPLPEHIPRIRRTVETQTKCWIGPARTHKCTGKASGRRWSEGRSARGDPSPRGDRASWMPGAHSLLVYLGMSPPTFATTGRACP